MTTATGKIPPPISWAQRNDLLYVIIDVECENIELKVTKDSLHFGGVNALDASKIYDVTLNFLHEVDPQRVMDKNIGRCMELTIYKKEPGAYWPSLTTDKTKLHFLKANFSKWKNESDEEDEMPEGNNPFDNLMSPGMNWNNKFDDFNVEEDEDSDDNIPSLSNNDDEEDEEQKDKDENKDTSDKKEK